MRKKAELSSFQAGIMIVIVVVSLFMFGLSGGVEKSGQADTPSTITITAADGTTVTYSGGTTDTTGSNIQSTDITTKSIGDSSGGWDIVRYGDGIYALRGSSVERWSNTGGSTGKGGWVDGGAVTVSNLGSGSLHTPARPSSLSSDDVYWNTNHWVESSTSSNYDVAGNRYPASAGDSIFGAIKDSDDNWVLENGGTTTTWDSTGRQRPNGVGINAEYDVNDNFWYDFTPGDPLSDDSQDGTTEGSGSDSDFILSDTSPGQIIAYDTNGNQYPSSAGTSIYGAVQQADGNWVLGDMTWDLTGRQRPDNIGRDYSTSNNGETWAKSDGTHIVDSTGETLYDSSNTDQIILADGNTVHLTIDNNGNTDESDDVGYDANGNRYEIQPGQGYVRTTSGGGSISSQGNGPEPLTLTLYPGGVWVVTNAEGNRQVFTGDNARTNAMNAYGVMQKYSITDYFTASGQQIYLNNGNFRTMENNGELSQTPIPSTQSFYQHEQITRSGGGDPVTIYVAYNNVNGRPSGAYGYAITQGNAALAGSNSVLIDRDTYNSLTQGSVQSIDADVNANTVTVVTQN